MVVIFFFAIGGPVVYQRLTHTDRLTDRRLKAATQTFLRDLDRALESYKNQYGNFPRPLGGSTDPVIQAKMLYQAVTGDGTNFIDGVPPIASDGSPGTDGELILEAAFPGSKRSAFVHEALYLNDPWGQPLRYLRGDEPGHVPRSNPQRFDLWSVGDPRAQGEPRAWITNWE